MTRISIDSPFPHELDLAGSEAMKTPRFLRTGSLVLLGSLALAGAGLSADKKSRDEMVIEDRDELQDDQTWIYNDIAKAREAAAAAGKAMMVVFRCIP